MPEEISIDELARMSQKQFAEIQGDVRSIKKDLNTLHREVEAGFQAVKADFAAGISIIREDIQKSSTTPLKLTNFASVLARLKAR
jgi:hypothetical protein